MNENVKIAAKIGGKVAIKWVFIFGAGIIFNIITFSIALYCNLGLLQGGQHGLPFIGLFFGMVFFNQCALLLVFGAPIFLLLYFFIANKISIQYAIYLLMEGKLGSYISSKVQDINEELTKKEGWRKDLSEKTMLKAKVLQATKNNLNTSKLQRKIISYGFTKIKLDGINFQDENLDLSDVLTKKINEFLSEVTSKPSLKSFWLLAISQLIILVLSFFFIGTYL